MNPQILDSTALIFPDELPSPLRRKAKIYARKLPQDFFGCRRAAMSLDRQPHQLPPNRNEVHTQAYSRKVPELARVCQTRDMNLRGNLSARRHEQPATTMSLLMGIICSTREMRKSIRKHSLEMRKQSSGAQECVQLPRLQLRKGVTGHF